MHSLQFTVADDPVDALLSICFGGAQDSEGILYDGLLDLMIECAVCLERGCLIDLEQPWFDVFVDEHIEAQHFETHAEGSVVWLACPIVVHQVRLHRYQRLDDQICYLELEKTDIHAVFLQPLVDGF